MTKEKQNVKYIKKNELDKVLDSENFFHKAIMTFLANTGLRISEFLSLNIGDLVYPDNEMKDVLSVITLKASNRRNPKFSREEIRLSKRFVEGKITAPDFKKKIKTLKKQEEWDWKRRKPKEEKRDIPLPAKGKAAARVLILDSQRKLYEMSNPDSPLCVSMRGERMCRQQIYRIVKVNGDRAGIRGTLSPHSFRHFFATELKRTGASTKTVQKLLGHASERTTVDMYWHNSLEEKQIAINKIFREDG